MVCIQFAILSEGKRLQASTLTICYKLLIFTLNQRTIYLDILANQLQKIKT